MRIKYPRTMHFSFSPGLQNDDRKLSSDDIFEGKEVVVTEKLDGECLSENTLIDTDKGKISIRDICKDISNYQVISFNQSSCSVELKPIVDFFIKENNDDWYELELESGDTIIATGNHKVYIPSLGCYRAVQELNGDEEFLVLEKEDVDQVLMKTVKLKSIKKVKSKSKRYDISVKDNHNFFANGILVHNCTTMYNDFYHARSLAGARHPSQFPCRSMHGTIQYKIPEGMRVCGENVFGKHSIEYTELSDWFYFFAMFDDNEGICMSWDDTMDWCAGQLELKKVPVLYRGPWDADRVKACYTGESKFGGEQEGYVVRNAYAFSIDDFSTNVAKFVRKGHVQTDKFWKKDWKPNKRKVVDV